MKKIIINTITPLIAQIVTFICGFILPRFILTAFGSQINGAVSSVTQFLGIISFFDMGVTSVLQSALYKPLATKNSNKLSEVVTSADKFFGNIGKILVGYILVLCLIFPYISKNQFDAWFWVTLILAMGLHTFGQSFLGVVDKTILVADQRVYFTAFINTLTIIVNTIFSVWLIHVGASIQLVKFSTSVIYLGRPIAYRIFVKKRYDINRKIKYTGEPIKQKWNGAAQHIAEVVLDGTDNVILTLFSSLTNVSIYQVYYLVVAAIKTLFYAISNAITPYIGKLWAEEDKKRAKDIFLLFEWIINVVAVLVFGCTASLIVKFIMVYTKGVSDANYFQPAFALLLVVATMIFALGIPYTSMIRVAGSYKQTQKVYILAAMINIVISVICVQKWGLVGVAIGTLISLVYQIIQLSYYVDKEILHEKMLINKIKLWICDALIFSVCYFCVGKISMECNSYIDIILFALPTGLIWLIISLVVWTILYANYFKRIILILKKYPN